MERSLPWDLTLIGDSGPYEAERWQNLWRINMGALMADADGFTIPFSGSGSIRPLWVRQAATPNNTVRVAPGAALVRGLFYESDAEMVWDVAPGVSGQPRIDRLVLTADFAQQTVRQQYLIGTPAANPQPPALTQVAGTVWQLPLATIAVAHGFISIFDADITNRLYLFRSGVGAPVGSIQAFAGANAPPGFLFCAGQTLNIADYPALFAVVGTTFGGNGTTTFILPDLRGRTIIGMDNMIGASANRVTNPAADTLGGVGGAETHTLTIAQLPPHSHNMHAREGVATSPPPDDDFRLNPTAPTHTIPTASVGSGQAHNNMQPYMALRYIIAY